MYFLKSAVRTVFFFGMVCLIFSITAHRAFSAQVTVAWDANKEDNLAGYTIYCGTASGNYDNSVDVGNNTQHTFSNLQAGVTYYIAATAYNTNHSESDYSHELIYTVPDSAPSEEAPNQAPIASFITEPASGDAPLTVTFDADQTHDPDGQIVNYEWDFGDGSIDESGAIVNHLFTEAGSYNVVLTVTDDDGLQAAASDTVEVVVPEGGVPGGGVPPLEPVNMVFEPSTSMNSPQSGHYILRFDVTGITNPIQESKISLFFENYHDRITIYCNNNWITTVYDVAAQLWYDIDLQDFITENKLYTFIITYDPYQQWVQEENQAELVVSLQ